MRKKLFYISSLLLLVFVITGCGTKTLKNFTIKSDDLIPINETRKINVSYEPSDLREEIKWSSSNEEIAEVKNGIISAKSLGNVTISAETTSGLKKSIKIEIYQKVDSLSLDKESVDLYVSETMQLNATIEPENATYKDINWSSSDNSVATIENGLITAKSIGEAKITATTKDGISKQCSVIVKEKPIEFSGSGDKIISDVNIPSGNYKAILSNNGSRNFIVKFYESSNDSYGELLANEIGSYNGSKVIRDGETTAIRGGMLEVKSSGNWSIKFERIGGTINGKSVNGTGDSVTGWFVGDGKRQVATFTNSESSNFIVKVYNQYGDSDLLVNEIGSYNGQAIFTTSSNVKYYYEISSSGSWTISWE